jgi:hypothetical protein
MLLSPGDKLLIAHRRLYESDQPRMFAGTVVAYESGFVKLAGYSWVREPVRGELKKKVDQRTKIVSIASPGLMCYQLPDAVDIGRLELKAGAQHQVILTDNAGFTMDLTDRNPALRMGSAA